MAIELQISELKTTAAVFLGTVVALKLISYLSQKRYKLPPGPRGVPILGYLPFFGNKPPVTFNELRSTYGDVISISMGSFPAIVINGRDTIKEALVTKGDDFSGRPAFTTAKLLNEGRNFAFSEFGPVWKMHRRLVMNVMHAFSNTRHNPIEDIIRSEANTIAKELLENGDKKFSPTRLCNTASSSMIYQLCYGRHMNIREDKDFALTLENTARFRRFTGAGNPVDVIPWLRFIMPWKVTGFLQLLKSGIARRNRKVAEHEETFDEHYLRDITDGLINAAKHLTPEEKAAGLDKRRAIESLDSIFGAGTATIASTLDWVMLLMAAFPQVQEKVVAEIEDVIGCGREPNLGDRHNLPYVEATLLEVFRFAVPVPFSLPHATTRDTTLNGFDIPVGTVVLVNLYSVSYDDELWGDSYNFRPERFLDEEGQLDRDKAELMVHFSLGRRRCAGEFLARMEVFLFFATLIQKVRFYKPPDAQPYSLDAVFSLGRDPVHYEICVAPRE